MAQHEEAPGPGSESPAAIDEARDLKPMPRAGATIGGKYLLERVVGQGGMAVVYEATHLRLRQRFAIKILVPKVAAIAEIAYRFEREARALVRLRGPNVAHVRDVDTTDEGLPYIVMDLLEGHDLAQELAERQGEVPIEEAVGYVLQACSAMAEAHALSIVHRDLKPANLFLTGGPSERVVKVLDFGISKILESDTTVTHTAVALGTPMYMSPEQIESARRVDGRTDIWSLGVILYELLTCELPFGGKGVSAIVASISSDAPKPLRSRRPDAPSGLIAVIMRALAKNPDERYQDVADFANALAPFGPAPHEWRAPELPARGASAAPLAPQRATQPALSPSPADEATVRGEREPSRPSESSSLGAQIAPRRRSRRTTAAALIVVALVVLGVVYALWR
jgi:serine/threonine-protein kinase